MEDKNQQGQNMYAIIFTIIAILALIGLVLLLFWRVQADINNTTQNLNVSSSPSITSYALYDQETVDVLIKDDLGAGSDSLTPIEGQNDEWSLEFSANDPDGCQTIDQGLQDETILSAGGTNVEHSFGAAGLCSLGDNVRDNDTCYIPDVIAGAGISSPSTVIEPANTCTGAGDSSYSASLQSAEADLDGQSNYTEYATHVEPGPWETTLKITDDSNLVTSGTLTFTMEAYNALDVTPLINYGGQAIGGNPSDTATTITFTNTGNVPMDALYHAEADMDCDAPASNDIPAEFTEIGGLGFVHEYEDGVSNGSSTGGNGTGGAFGLVSGGSTYNFGGTGVAKAQGDPAADFVSSAPAADLVQESAVLQVYVQDLAQSGNLGGTCTNTLVFTSAQH